MTMAAVSGGAGGQQPAGRGRGGLGGPVPFVAGGGRGGAAGAITPGTYTVRLTVGGQTMLTSVVVLEDIWMR